MPASPMGLVSTHPGDIDKRQNCKAVTTLGVPEHTEKRNGERYPNPPPAAFLD